MPVLKGNTRRRGSRTRTCQSDSGNESTKGGKFPANEGKISGDPGISDSETIGISSIHW
jgi:hypothetical protein